MELETKQRTTKALEIMQAFLDGLQIQRRRNGTGCWEPAAHPTWNWNDWEYRVTPPPDKTFEESVRAHLKDKIEGRNGVCSCGVRAMKDLYRKLFNEE